MWPNIINIIGFFIRLLLIINMSGNDDFHQGNLSVFTDWQYKVSADTAHYSNPYHRHTFHESPIIAKLLGSSFAINQNLGKIIIALFDVIACYFLSKLYQSRKNKSSQQNKRMSILASLAYAINPLYIYITVRGNSEGIIMAFLFAFLYYFFSDQVHGFMSAFERRDRGYAERQPNQLRKYVSYAIFGLALHFRLSLIFIVPLLVMYEYYSVKQNNLQHAVRFTIEFMVVSGGVFLALAAFYYSLYGKDYLDQTYLSPLIRRENRYSYSAFFYEIYLNYQNDALAGSVSRTISRWLPLLIILGSACFKLIKYHTFYNVLTFVLFSFVVLSKTIQLHQISLWSALLILAFAKLDLKLPTIQSFVNGILKLLGVHLFFLPSLVLWNINVNSLSNGVQGFDLKGIWYICLSMHFLYIMGFYRQMSKIEPYTGLQKNTKIENMAKKIPIKKYL